MQPDESSIEFRQFSNRSVGLMVFGVVEFGIGLLCALFAPLMIFSWQIAPEQMPVGQMLASIYIYAVLAAFFVAMGTGSMLVRRWARALMLVTAWMWLIGGILGATAFAFLFPSVFDAMSAPGGLPPEMVLIMVTIIVAVTFFLYILLPAAFVIFYQSKHVKWTCEFYDRRVRWTDRCPLPVLAVVVALGFLAIFLPANLAYNGVMPVFGTLVSGPPGMGITLGLAALSALLAWGLYKQARWAWWGALAFVFVYTASGVFTFSRIDLFELYAAMGMSNEQIAMMRDQGFVQNFPAPLMTGMFGLGGAIAIGYLIAIRRYLGVPDDRPITEPPAA